MTKMNNEKLTSPPRERVSVGITGIDRSTPDDMVEDGKCETLHNMRYEAGAWRPVHPYTLSKTIPNLPATMNVVYKHPAAPENIYIVESVANNLYAYYAYDITKIYYEAGALTTLISRSPERLKVSHFGNVLVFYTSSSPIYYMLEGEVYKKFIIPPPPSTQVVKLDTSSMTPKAVVKKGDSSWTKVTDSNWESLSNTRLSDSVFHLENLTTGETAYSNAQGQWFGEIMVFATWRMKDGTILSPSPLHLIKSYGASQYTPAGVRRTIGVVSPGIDDTYIDSSGKLNYIDTDKFFGIQYSVWRNIDSGENENAIVPFYDGSLRFATPTVRIRLPKDAPLDFIESVSLWSTRIYPEYNYNKHVLGAGEVRPHENDDYYADNRLAEQPFFLVEDILIREFQEEPHPEDPIYIGLYYDIVLDGLTLSNIIHNEIYVPENNIHELVPNGCLDYNNRLHYYNFRQKLHPPYKWSAYNNEGDTPLGIRAEVKVDNNVYSTYIYDYLSERSPLEGTPQVYCLSYPDHRATSLSFLQLGDFTLRPAIASNFALYTQPNTMYEKYPPIVYKDGSLLRDWPNPINDAIVAPNKIQASALNNLFNLPFDSNYALGHSSNSILALQSAAIEMSDAKFGEMPLYAFTTEGIYALQAGNETLYSNVFPINYDKIINPNTLAINGAVAYITEKGVHLLTNQGSQVISTPINDKSNRPPLDFLRKCKMIYPKEHNEIILLDEDNIEGIAYVYNLDARYWSTRDLKGKKLNTDELYSTNILYDLANEDESKTLPAEIKTRPIKLGNVEFKRLETIIPRMSTHSHPALFTAEVTGSVDGFNYMPLRSTDGTIPEARVNPLVLRRTPFSAKYFKFGFTFNPSENKPLDLSISHVDIEWYRKLQHRMR